MSHMIREKWRTSEEALGTSGHRKTTSLTGGWGSSGNGKHLLFIVGGLCLKPVTGHPLAKKVRQSDVASMFESGGSNTLSLDDV